MEKYIDLHCHSVHSEGKLNVQGLLMLAKKNQIKALALTDHNSISGVAELLKLSKKFGIEALTGVELYVQYQGRPLHLLGYNFAIDNPALNKAINGLQEKNIDNVKKSVNSLREQGFKIKTTDIINQKSCNYGVIHLLMALEKYPENIAKINRELTTAKREFFNKVGFYFGQGKPAHLPLVELPIKQGIDIIKQCGGFTSLAHPGQQLNFEQDTVILELKKMGLDGLETLSPYHTWHQIEHYQNLALTNNLLMTGGSDYHSDIDFSKEKLVHRQWDYFKVPYVFFENIKIILKKDKKL